MANAPTPSRSEIRALAERLIAARQAWHAFPGDPWNDETPELEAYVDAELALDAALTPEVVIAILADGEDAERWRFVRDNCQWIRRDDGDGERTYIEVRVLNGADLSCAPMVDTAVDQVRAARSVSRPTQDGDPREVDRG